MDEKELSEEFTPEEQEALAAMKADDEPEADEPETPEADEPEAPEAEQPAEQPDDPDRQKMVPHQALHQAREEAKALRQEMAELKAWRDAQEQAKQQDAAQKAEAERLEAEKQNALEVPDPVLEPQKYQEYEAEKDRRVQERFAAFEAAQRQQQQEAFVSARQEQQEKAFAAQTPDYAAARDFAKEARARELAFAYPTATEAQVQQQVEIDMKEFAATQIATGMDAAQRIYEYAKIRGYAPSTPTPDTAEADKLAAQAAAQKNMTSLSSAGASPGVGDLTIERIAAMSETEQRKAQAENPEAFMRALGA